MATPTGNAHPKLIVALDFPAEAAAMEIVAALGDLPVAYKVGMELYTAEGPRVVRALTEAGRPVFLDLKYYDIPNTVKGAVKAAGRLAVSMLTVHGGGGAKMLSATVQEARRANPEMMVLAVTVLTSMDLSDLGQLGVPGSVSDQVLRLGTMAIQCGCHGLVASAQEAALLRSELGEEFAIVTPGVRPAGSDVGDQARVVTPAQAMAAGATHIVVGRPITGADDPAAAARAILKEME